ncbi:MAG: hypothetical protein F6K24_27095 [Okeania sp. SIO2D1]|nr:hypothetical protein [Okeania sp. SIO2D1]
MAISEFFNRRNFCLALLGDGLVLDRLKKGYQLSVNFWDDLLKFLWLSTGRNRSSKRENELWNFEISHSP